MTDDTNITPEAGDSRQIFRGHLRTVPAGEQFAEPVTVDAPPADSMRGLKAEEMFLGGSERVDGQGTLDTLGEDPELNEPQLAPAVAPDIEPATLEDPSAGDDFELSYSDGSTTPPLPPRRSFVRRRSHSEEDPVDQERLTQALEDTAADVWAAHRDESWAANRTDAWGASAEPFAAAEQPPRDSGGSRGLARLALITVLVVVLGVVAFVAVNGGEAPKRSVTHKPKSPLVTQTVARTVTKPAVTTPAKTVVKKHHKKRVLHHRKATTRVASTTTTTATTTVTPVTTAVTQTTPPVADTTSTGEAKSTTPAKTTPVKTTPVKTTTSSTSSTPTNNESPGGALPGVQQTQHAP
jgi:hypothetical protein